MVMNGNAEIGPCSFTGEFVRPEIWNYNGNVTQFYYSPGASGYVNETAPGPT